MLDGLLLDGGALATGRQRGGQRQEREAQRDQAAAAAQIGRPLTAAGLFTVNLTPQGEVYGPRVRQWDLAAKKIFRFGGQRLTAGLDIYNVTNDNVTLGFNQTFVPNVAGWQNVTSYMNPRVFRLSGEFAF